MRTSLLVVLVVGLCLIGLSSMASAQGGDEPGACLVTDAIPETGTSPGGQFFNFCIDNVTESQCDEFCFKPGVGPDSGIGIGECDFIPNADCAEQPFAWDGACDVPGFACVLIDGPTPAESEQLCDEGGKGGTSWFPGATTCGGAPVPALPKAAYAALALVLLAGSLALLTVFSKNA